MIVRKKGNPDPALLEELAAYLETQTDEAQSEEPRSVHFSRELDYSKIRTDIEQLEREYGEACRDGALSDVSDVVEAGEEESTFTDLLLHHMKLRQYSSSQCYKKAHIDRKLYSQIQKDRFYKPKKATAVAFALALELNPDEADEFLEAAGFALSKSDVSDLIIQFCIDRKIYDIDLVNAILCRFGKKILGSR